MSGSRYPEIWIRGIQSIQSFGYLLLLHMLRPTPLESFKLGHPRRWANSNPPTSAVTASALPLSEPLHEQSHAVCTASTLLLCSPPAALAVSHCIPPHCSRSRVRKSKFRHPFTAVRRLGMFSHSNSARYFCSLQQGESSSSERAEVAFALAGAAARSALVRALSARIMRVSLSL